MSSLRYKKNCKKFIRKFDQKYIENSILKEIICYTKVESRHN